MNAYAKAYNSWPAGPSNQIVLLATPISTLKALGIKKRIDVVAHWTICINGWCYELARQDNKKFPYRYRPMPEQVWRAYRAHQGKPIETHLVGYMAMPYSHDIIDEVASLVWERSLEQKYAYDEHNCQVFIRLLVELIGSSNAKADFPAALDQCVRGANNTRDGSIIVFAAGAALFAASVSSLAFDPTGSAAAFGIAAHQALRSSSYLLTVRDLRARKIKQGQKEIRQEMKRRRRPLAEPEAKK